MAKYARPEYWDARYQQDPDPFEWYQNFEGLKHVLRPHLQLQSKILQVGCGNSRVAEDMYINGWRDITNIDISSVAIEMMAKKHADKPEMKWLVMDVTQMDFPEKMFDVIIDKGTLDSLLCGDDAEERAEKMLRGVSSLLKPSGVYICISYGLPENRLSHFEEHPEYGWKVTSVATIPKPQILRAESRDDQDSVHYCYICTKDDPLDA
eukprot:TRINITY_DN7095_c0_g1_i2.p1 TRINITY_DN7095_c0_g1~~TRINITY_DN7095_c0_g1_i2.p1  ORF type:complete len:208 (-),score=33.02 TRINITY_DN7095_c0_g1_i2:47-670(-)